MIFVSKLFAAIGTPYTDVFLEFTVTERFQESYWKAKWLVSKTDWARFYGIPFRLETSEKDSG